MPFNRWEIELEVCRRAILENKQNIESRYRKRHFGFRKYSEEDIEVYEAMDLNDILLRRRIAEIEAANATAYGSPYAKLYLKGVTPQTIVQHFKSEFLPIFASLQLVAAFGKNIVNAGKTRRVQNELRIMFRNGMKSSQEYEAKAQELREIVAKSNGGILSILRTARPYYLTDEEYFAIEKVARMTGVLDPMYILAKLRKSRRGRKHIDVRKTIQWISLRRFAICPKCNLQNPVGSNFCSKCGRGIER